MAKTARFTWQPDTCGCLFSLDRTTGEPIETLRLCARHTHLGGAEAGVFVAAQNREKNKVVNEIAKELNRRPEDIEFFMDNDEVEVIIGEQDQSKARGALMKLGLSTKLHTMRPFRG
jgi:hypothetical protein